MNKTRDIEWFINESSDLAEARKNGVDLWALWHNLQRTPAERMRRHQIALDTYFTLQDKGLVDQNLLPDDSGLSIDLLLQIKEMIGQPCGYKAIQISKR